jgi:flavin-dependent dehydrogenase
MAGKSTSFDVIVAGGGPAGCAAAIGCSLRGLRTLLLEASVSAVKRPGETLPPGIETLFRSLHVDVAINQAGFVRHPGYVVRSGRDFSIQRYGADARGEWLGYQADRAELNRLLLAQAIASGARVSRPEKAIKPIVKGGEVRGVATASREYSSAFVVDGSGPSHWLAVQLGLPVWRVSPRLVARYGWIELPGDPAPQALLPEFRIDGCAWRWTAPVGANRYAWVHLALGTDRQAAPPCPEPAASLVRRSRARASDVTWRVVRPCAGPGYFLAGDAACVLDPASSHGVLKAIASGMAAAEAVARALETPASGNDAAATYCRGVEEWFCRDAEALVSLYGRTKSPPPWLTAASASVRYILRYPSA